MNPPTPPPIPLSKLLCDLIDAKAIITHRFPHAIRPGYDAFYDGMIQRVTEVCAQIDAAYPAVVPPSAGSYVVKAVDTKGNEVHIRASEFTHHP